MECATTSDCTAGNVCRDGACVGASDASTDVGDDTGDAGDSGGCAPTEIMCGFGASTACCGAGEVCFRNMCAEDCGAAPRCGTECCGDGLTCEDDRCVAACEDVTKRCGADDELCCGGEQVCLSRMCVDLGSACESGSDCEDDEICLPSEMRCVPRDSVEGCTVDPPPAGEFTPRIACSWDAPAGEWAALDRAIASPSVANLTDDNGDGRTDENDIPDIAFPSAVGGTSVESVIRIVSGECGEEGTMRTIATIGPNEFDVSNAILLANLHPDSMEDERAPEIVATARFGIVVAFTRVTPDGSEWREMWRTEDILRGRTSSGLQPAAADFGGDGQPEVFVGNIVLNGLTGEVVWDGDTAGGPAAGTGHNGFLGPISTAADIDLDGELELVTGSTIYSATGAVEWSYDDYPVPASGSCTRRCDGYPAVGNFDEDDFAEVVVVRDGTVYFFEHDGTLSNQVDVPWDDCTNAAGTFRRNESGPPTVADFDGDGRPEVGTAGADFYAVIDLDCLADPLPAECDSEGVLWKVPNLDCSSRATGSSVFDFEGDGRAEVIYADERSFRIFDGQTGAILFSDDTHISNTRVEMPVVVDVDNDGKSEILVPEPRNTAEGGGIEVWEDTDNNWVRTRRIWNQHSYHVTNITEDGQVPRLEEPNWMNPELNNFRQNVQPDNIFDAPDLVVLEVETIGCTADGNVRIQVTVANEGAIGAGSGLPVAVYATPMGGAETFVGVVRTTRLLLPGQVQRLEIEWAAPESTRMLDARAVVDSDGMGGSEYRECREGNNEGEGGGLMGCSAPI